MRRSTLIWTGILVSVWTTYGLVCAWQSHYWYAFTKTPMTWAECLRLQLVYSTLWAVWTPVVVFGARRFRFERRTWPRNLAIHVLLMLLTVSVTKLLFDLLLHTSTSAFYRLGWQSLFRSIESTLDVGPLLYALVVLVEMAIIYYRRYQSGLIKASQLQTQLIQAQLRALRMHLHPHFLFNTLHTITALVHEDPDRAERTIARLGELLRLYLATSSIHEVPLNEELRVLDLYLEIERARFEERLQIRYDVPDPLKEASVPNLLLQPLVENSIRHGIGKRSSPGWIAVTAERYTDTLVLTVTDNGEGLKGGAKGPSPQGTGLSITRGRLESLYGSRQSLVLRNLPGGGAEVRITLPFRVQLETYCLERCAESNVEL